MISDANENEMHQNDDMLYIITNLQESKHPPKRPVKKMPKHSFSLMKLIHIQIVTVVCLAVLAHYVLKKRKAQHH